MNRKMIYLLWAAYPITKVVYIFIALNQSIVITNEISNIHFVFLGLGLLLCVLSIVLSRNIYTNKKLYSYKLIRSLYFRDIQGMKKEEYILFSLFITSLSLIETISLFGLISFLMTGNIIAFYSMLALTIIVWAINFPKLTKFNNIMESES